MEKLTPLSSRLYQDAYNNFLCLSVALFKLSQIILLKQFPIVILALFVVNPDAPRRLKDFRYRFRRFKDAVFSPVSAVNPPSRCGS